MSKINNKTITIIKNVALYFFVICFSLSNISLFNMVLSYAGYQGDVTLISSIIYAFFNLFILAFFIYYVLSHKQYKMLLIILLINLIYIFPHLLNFTIRDIALYLMFPLPFSLFAGIIAVDQNIRKRFIDAFYKLRYIYSIFGIAYICFLAFSTEENRGALIDFTYGNVAWVFLPPIFVYIGLIIQKDFFRESEHIRYKKYELIGILLLLEITVFYTGLRTGIISLFFAKILFLITFLIVDYKKKKKYFINFLVLLSIVIITYVVSSLFILERSRMNIISDNFIFEKQVHVSDEFVEDDNKDITNSEKKIDNRFENDRENEKINGNEILSRKNTTKEIVYTTSSVYVRPKKNSKESLGILLKGEEIEGENEGDWFRFDYKGEEAFIAARLTNTERPNKIETVHTISPLHIRPNKGSKKSLGILPKWSEIEGYREGSWFRFMYEGKESFIASQHTKTEPLTADEIRDKEIENLLSINASDSSLRDKINVIDVEDNQVKSVHSVFIKHVTENDLAVKETEKKLTEDIKKDTRKYIIARDIDRARLSQYTIYKDRYNLWNMAFREFKKSPLIGQGALFYQTKYDEFFPHNIILEILTDFGIVGLIIIMSFATLLIYKSIKYIKQKKDKSMLLILAFGLSYIPAYLLYNSLYSDNSLAFLITLLATYVIFNKEKTETIETIE